MGNKKFIIIGLIILLVFGIGGYIFYSKYYTITNTTDDYGVHQLEDGTYTRGNSMWVNMKVDNVIQYLGVDKSVATKPVYLTTSVMDGLYVQLDLPAEKTYVNEFGSMLFATDGSIVVYMYKGDLSTLELTVNDAKAYNKNIVYTDNNNKVVHKVVNYLLDGYVLFAECYSDSNDWTTLLNSICSVEETTVYRNNITNLPYLPDKNPLYKQSVFLSDEYMSGITYFMDGYFYTQNIDMNKDVEDEMSDWVQAMSSGKGSYIYKDSEIIVTYSDDMYTLALIPYNTSYKQLLIGYGDEARTNILYIIDSLKE